MYKNMKIEINEQQPLDEVIKELERLGYKKSSHGRWVEGDKMILTSEHYKTFSRVDLTFCNFYRLTTLAELKEM